jgi:MFS family permease
MTWLSDVFSRGVWRNRDFRRLWSAATVSTFGADITNTALPFVAILTLDATAWDIGLLRIASIAPAFAVGLLAGAWLDRVRRRPVMIACDWIRAALLLTIPLAAWLDWLRPSSTSPTVPCCRRWSAATSLSKRIECSPPAIP